VRGRKLLLPLLLACLLADLAARADDSPQQQLQAVQKAIEEGRAKQAELAKQADALAAEINQLRDDEVAAAHAAQTHEAALTRFDAQLAGLAAEEKTKTAALAQQRARQAQLLMALTQLARDPPEGLEFEPGDPIDRLRGGILLSAAVPPIMERARLLRIELATLADLRAQIADTKERQRTEGEALARDQARIALLIAQKAAWQRQAAKGAQESGQHLMQLAAQASDLHELIERLDAEQKREDAERRKQAEAEAARQARLAAPPAAKGPAVEVVAPAPLLLDPARPKSIRPFAQARGRMVYPASGAVVRSYGEADELGQDSKGLTLETRPGAEVVAPFDGRILFAGPFKGYGQILIIGHGDGYHSLVAGLDRVEASVGQWLVAGEPIGVMSAGGAKPRLYLELRHDGQPINPLPWLATRDEKVNG
jgi:septal ring factor EnvC (AmiA/AmiB activator)